MTIAEGKFHQVKRMVAYCGKEVVDLQRLTMGTLVLDENLERGEWRRLIKEELENLLAILINFGLYSKKVRKNILAFYVFQLLTL